MTSGYRHPDAEPASAHAWLLPRLERVLAGLRLAPEQRRLFDLGCGNGAVAARLAARGYEVTGVDVSEEGIRRGRQRWPGLQLFQGSAYEDLAQRFGRFPVVISLEVVEHLYEPRRFARTLFDLVEPGGWALLSTPYHGYWKNLALALSGRLDAHFTALWDHGHIKFWSERTLGILLREAGFEVRRTWRLGRVPPLAKSMLVAAQRPAADVTARRSQGAPP